MTSCGADLGRCAIPASRMTRNVTLAGGGALPVLAAHAERLRALRQVQGDRALLDVGGPCRKVATAAEHLGVRRARAARAGEAGAAPGWGRRGSGWSPIPPRSNAKSGKSGHQPRRAGSAKPESSRRAAWCPVSVTTERRPWSSVVPAREKTSVACFPSTRSALEGSAVEPRTVIVPPGTSSRMAACETLRR